jgi:hypothetical protein
LENPGHIAGKRLTLYQVTVPFFGHGIGLPIKHNIMFQRDLILKKERDENDGLIKIVSWV